MSSPRSPNVTVLLNRLGEGDQSAVEPLMKEIYEELYLLAEVHLGERHSKETLGPTALVNEAWIRLVDQKEAKFATRSHFYSLASKIMRSVLVDYARSRSAEKRGGGWQRVTIAGESAAHGMTLDLLTLDEAMKRLADIDADLCRLVELRFFGGLNNKEIACVLETSLRTVERNWRLARAWLHGELAS